jgi:uncharacterized protein (DUF1778 family)
MIKKEEAPMDPGTNQKSERIDVRTTPHVKSLLQEAAAAANKTVSEFLLDSALTEAAEVLANRNMFFLDEKQWQEFVAALDAPPSSMPRLKKLLREPSLLERQNGRNDR